eukprot:scaffold5089_cov127-Isochrysis_galbana.AAC.4
MASISRTRVDMDDCHRARANRTPTAMEVIQPNRATAARSRSRGHSTLKVVPGCSTASKSWPRISGATSSEAESSSERAQAGITHSPQRVAQVTPGCGAGKSAPWPSLLAVDASIKLVELGSEEGMGEDNALARRISSLCWRQRLATK